MSIKDSFGCPSFGPSGAGNVGILTKRPLAVNIDENLFAFSAQKLQVDFDWVITAEQVGSYKPSHRNFEVMLERLALPKKKILHAVYRWRQGRLCPPEEVVQQLARMGKQQAQLDGVWGESMLRAARYDDVTSLVNQIWGAQVMRTIPSNLPPPAYTRFVGRQDEMADLLKLLSPTYAAPSLFLAH